ncbi:MAG: transcription initiation factor IIB [Ignisphaera sp.]
MNREWRAFSMEEERSSSRVGIPSRLTIHDRGLYTEISNSSSDSKQFSPERRHTVARLRKLDKRCKRTTALYNLQRAITELMRLKDKLAISNEIAEDAAYIYRKALKKGLVRGRGISAFAAAALYAACRRGGVVKTLTDIVDASGLKSKQIKRCYNRLICEFDLKIPVIDAVSFLNRLASKTGLSEKTKRKAMILIEKIKTTKLATRTPICLAATALYLAALYNEQTTQKTIADAAGITPVTIRNLKVEFIAELDKSVWEELEKDVSNPLLLEEARRRMVGMRGRRKMMMKKEREEYEDS